jgi:hypothetical protein
MNIHKTRKGFSAIIIIIIILVLAGLGAGYYFFYDDYVAPLLNPYAKLIPKGLSAYAKGKNAEAFIIIRNDPEIKDAIIKSSPQSADQVNSFDGAIAVVNTTKLSGAIVMLFNTPEKAAELKTTAESQVQSGPVTFTFEQKDKVLIASFGGGLDAMEGPLLDNPAVKKLDPAMMDSQVVAYAAISQMGIIGDAMGSMLTGGIGGPGNLSSVDEADVPIAHAQATDAGLEPTSESASFADFAPSSLSASPAMMLLSLATFIPFIDDTTLYVRYRNSLFDIKVDIGFLEKSALATSPLIKNTILKNDATKIGELEKTYDGAFAAMEAMTGQVQKLLDEQTKAYPGTTAKISYANRKLSLTINFAKEVAEKEVQDLMGAQLSAPAKARDAARKAHLNALVTSLEAYNLDTGNYPEKSTCTDAWESDLPEFTKYMQGGQSPVDPAGSQTFGTITCPGGYYYQSFGEKGYALWGKMDLETDGNTSLTPEEVASGQNLSFGTSGTYFMLNKSYFPSDTTDNLTTSPAKKKVKRPL